MFSLASVLKLLDAVGPVIAAAPAFKNIYDEIVGTFKTTDQEQLQEAYEDLIKGNDEGHRRLQQKLEQAARG